MNRPNKQSLGWRVLRYSLKTWSRSALISNHLRRQMLRAAGLDVLDSMVLSGVNIAGEHLHLGDDVFINEGCYLDARAPIVFERSVNVGMRAKFITSAHEIGPPSKRAGRIEYKPITIGEGTWVGAGAIILGGVSVGSGCIVAAGSVVTRDVAPNCLVAGIPARVVRDLP